MVTAVSVLPLNSQVFPGHNQETYQRLQVAAQSIPPHHLWLASCDDLPLQRQLAATLEESLQRTGTTAATQRLFDVEQPNLVQQIQNWLPKLHTGQPTLLQILGLEQLTYGSSDTQYQFLRSLHQLWPQWQQMDVSLLLWMPRPWLKQIRREVPNLGRSAFEFIGEPTPISTISHQPNFQVAFSTVRGWQFLGKPSPEVPANPQGGPEGESEIMPSAIAVPTVPQEAEELNTLDDAVELDLPTFSEALWHQLQNDLSDFEAAPAKAAPTAFQDAEEATILARESKDSSQGLRYRPDPEPLPAESVDQAAMTKVDAELESPRPPEFQVLENDWQADWPFAFELRDRVQLGDHNPALLEAAIQAYESLQPYQPSTWQRTEVLNDLGSLYWLWAQQATTVDEYFQRLIQSSKVYEAALSPISEQTAAAVLNRLHSNLGSVYSLLAVYQNPSYYLGKAVRAFHRALQYAPVETMPDEYATLQTHLGTAYWSLSQQTQEPTHLHRAIAAYQEALRQSQPQTSPQAYAQLQNNLGIALWSLARHERPSFLLEQAIGAYRSALAYRTLEADKLGYAATQNNLGTAYWDLGGHCEERSLHQQQAWRRAIIAYESAIAAVEQLQPEESEAISFDPWATHHSVGVVYDQLAIMLAPDATIQRPLLTRATTHYVSALMGWQAIESAASETALQALIRNLQLQSRFLGIEVQQRSLSQVPAEWLPQIWRKL